VTGHNTLIKPNQLVFDYVGSERKREKNGGFEVVTKMLGYDSLTPGSVLVTFLKEILSSSSASYWTV
jgi:hypothetical protein